jgi:hypothetical protein
VHSQFTNSPREDKRRIGALFRHHDLANPPATSPQPIGCENSLMFLAEGAF